MTTSAAPASSAYLITVFVLAGFLIVASHSASIMKRSPGEGKDDPECPGRQPCGWLVYNKSTRNSEFFMNNTCVCSALKHCLQTDDDLSVGAFVYRCIEKKEYSSLIPS